MDIKLTNSFSKISAAGPSNASRSAVMQIVLVLIVGGLFYWFLLLPKIADNKAKHDSLNSTQDQKASVDQDLQTLKTLDQQLADAKSKSEITNLDEALPLSERAVRVEMLMEKLTQSSGAIVGSIAIDQSHDGVVAGNPAVISDPYSGQRTLGSVGVDLRVSGTMEQLIDLIKKLESYGRIMDISSLDISLNQGSVLDMKLSLTTYYFGLQ